MMSELEKNAEAYVPSETEHMTLAQVRNLVRWRVCELAALTASRLDRTLNPQLIRQTPRGKHGPQYQEHSNGEDKSQ